MQDKLENNYSVYQHVTPDKMYYFGATSNIKRRWSNNGAKYKKTSLQPYIEKYGWENIKHIVLFRDQTRENALWIEDFLITTAREDGVCINKQRSGLISKEEGYKQEYYEENKDKFKEYYEENKEQIIEQRKQYREENKEQILEQRKQYREQNKDKIKQYYEENKDKFKEYYEKNKDKKLEYQQQYYEKNKDKRLEKQKQYREQNKDKIQEYNRQYYQRKKKEKQFKELGYIPLF